ncbi:MAG: NAD-dependent epimerase/dehydratase family protein [Acidimicrobiia bacterium]
MSDLETLAGRFAGARCVVTGGLGFIGSNTALSLAGAGAEVTVIDALVPQHGGDRRNLDEASVAVIVSSIGDDEAIGPAVDGADFVFNIAGQVSHFESMTDPLRDLELNARSQLAFLESVRRRAPRATVVHTSTRQVYGRPRYLPVDESHPTNPVDVNGIDKLAGEQFHLLYAHVHGMNISALRLTNVYGPRQCLTKNGLGFLPVFFRLALSGEPISVFGDGEQLRDCLFVDDVVGGLFAAAQSPDSAGEVFNLGHPQPATLYAIGNEIASAAAAGTTVSLVPWPDGHQQIDIGSFHGDYSKAERLLGWTPGTTLLDGVARTVAFYRERPWYLSSI